MSLDVKRIAAQIERKGLTSSVAGMASTGFITFLLQTNTHISKIMTKTRTNTFTCLLSDANERVHLGNEVSIVGDKDKLGVQGPSANKVDYAFNVGAVEGAIQLVHHKEGWQAVLFSKVNKKKKKIIKLKLPKTQNLPHRRQR